MLIYYIYHINIKYICIITILQNDITILQNYNIITILQNDNDGSINVLKTNDLKGRPIVAGPNSPTQALSSFIEKLLKPIVPCLTTYVKDDWHFIKQLPTTLNYETTLYSCDIESLYTSIPIDLGLEAISYWLNNKSNLILNRFSKNLY